MLLIVRVSPHPSRPSTAANVQLQLRSFETPSRWGKLLACVDWYRVYASFEILAALGDCVYGDSAFLVIIAEGFEVATVKFVSEGEWIIGLFFLVHEQSDRENREYIIYRYLYS